MRKLIHSSKLRDYYLTTDGEVYSLQWSMSGKPPELHKLHMDKEYPRVQMEGTQPKLHILMLETFVGPRPEGMLALHNDGDPSNNSLDNLRWGTPSDNSHDALRHGTHPTKGKRACNRKLTLEQAAEIRTHRAEGWTMDR